MRVPLGNPSALLRRLDWLGRAIINLPALWLWATAVSIAAAAAISHWDELVAQAAPHLGSPRFLLIMWLCYPLIKLVHELGHGLAVRRWGGSWGLSGWRGRMGVLC